MLNTAHGVNKHIRPNNVNILFITKCHEVYYYITVGPLNYIKKFVIIIVCCVNMWYHMYYCNFTECKANPWRPVGLTPGPPMDIIKMYFHCAKGREMEMWVWELSFILCIWIHFEGSRGQYWKFFRW